MDGIDRLHGIAEDVGRTVWLRDLGAALSETADAIEGGTSDPSGHESEVLAWVEENGGLEAVKERTMPEGMSWPFYEDGEPVRIGEYVICDERCSPAAVDFIEFNESGFKLYGESGRLIAGSDMPRHGSQEGLLRLLRVRGGISERLHETVASQAVELLPQLRGASRGGGIMTTDSERREVARRLRKTRVERYNSILNGIHLGEIVGVGAQIVSPHEDQVRAAADRLADLIEPSESGQNRDRNQDSVQKESHIVQIDHECDRDALLKLADDLDGMGDGSMYDPCISDEHGIASRIREILGV